VNYSFIVWFILLSNSKIKSMNKLWKKLWKKLTNRIILKQQVIHKKYKRLITIKLFIYVVDKEINLLKFWFKH
jgi:hypothetical protein